MRQYSTIILYQLEHGGGGGGGGVKHKNQFDKNFGGWKMRYHLKAWLVCFTNITKKILDLNPFPMLTRQEHACYITHMSNEREAFIWGWKELILTILDVT